MNAPDPQTAKAFIEVVELPDDQLFKCIKCIQHLAATYTFNLYRGGSLRSLERKVLPPLYRGGTSFFTVLHRFVFKFVFHMTAHPNVDGNLIKAAIN